MARQFSLPNNLKPVQILFPQTTNAAVTSGGVNLKNFHKAWIVLEFTQAVGHATTPTLNQATTSALSTNKAGPTSRIWANEDTAASDALVAKTAGASYAVTNDVKKKQVVFELVPEDFDIANGYQWAYITIATSSQATNLVSATVYGLPHYQQATPPTAIT